MQVGAGTVTDLDRLDRAVGAGASFIVTPVVNIPVIERCRELGVAVFPEPGFPPENEAPHESEGETAVQLGAYEIRVVLEVRLH